MTTSTTPASGGGYSLGLAMTVIIPDPIPNGRFHHNPSGRLTFYVRVRRARFPYICAVPGCSQPIQRGALHGGALSRGVDAYTHICTGCLSSHGAILAGA